MTRPEIEHDWRGLDDDETAGRTGWPAPALAQDDDRKLFRWFASRTDARQRVREACWEITDAAEELVRADSCLRAIWTAIASHAKPIFFFLLAVLIVAAISN